MNPTVSETGRGKLRPDDLFSLEQYSRQRAEFRPKVIAHKRARNVQCGPNAMMCFEDRLTVQYQVQEMLRIERIFESEGIADELAAYNPLIPDGTNWKATLLVEFPDADERRAALAALKGVEDRCWVQVSGHERVFAIADEDLERENDERRRRCTSCGSSCRRRWWRPRRVAQRCPSASITIITGTRSSRCRPRPATRWCATWPDGAGQREQAQPLAASGEGAAIRWLMSESG